MSIKIIQITFITCSFISITNQIAAASQKTSSSSINYNARVYYKPTNVLDKNTKGAKIIGIYQRAQIGNDGAYGTFTQKGKTLSQTVLEHNPTTASISGVTNNKAVGYIQNTNPGAGMSTGAPAYLSLYPYIEPIPQQKKAASHKHSMAMKTANYTQKK